MSLERKHLIVRCKAFDLVPSQDCDVPDSFPNCCERHEKYLEDANKWFEIFPNDTDENKKLAKNPWFKKKDYADAPFSLVKKVVQTERHIWKYIFLEDWYKQITGYIASNIISFCNPRIGIEHYILHIKNFIDFVDLDIPKIKRKQLILFLSLIHI